MRRKALFLLLALVPAACATSPPESGGSPASTFPSSPAASASPRGPSRPVFVVVMENRSYQEALADPVIASLASRYALAADYHAVAHPSLPNYLALTSGSTWGIADDAYHLLPPTGLGWQLDRRQVPWRAYMEGMASSCLANTYPYAVKHDPFAYYGGVWPRQVVPLAYLAGDLARGAGGFSWISPGLCHDGHDCSLAVASSWLASIVSEIVKSSSWRAGGVLFVTWDEDDGSAGNHVAALVIAASLKRHVSSRPYDHYSLLATIEDLLALPRLGRAVGASTMDDLV